MELYNLNGEKYDITNALSLAGVIILLINPLSLFDIGFQLSFACIFAIITMVKPMSNIFAKINNILI